MTQCDDLLEMTEQPDYDLETFVSQAVCLLKEETRRAFGILGTGAPPDASCSLLHIPWLAGGLGGGSLG